ncbi:MAG: hypothetical protein AABX16_00405, partial [Nanoarchaeota archaeon]
KEWLKNFSDEEILAKDKEFWDFLSEHAYPVTKGSMRIPISLEPFFIDNREYTRLKTNLLHFVSAAKKIANKYYEDDEIKKIIILNEHEQALIEHSKDEDFVGILRLDTFWDNGIKIVEINADFPDGLFMHDVTSEKILSFLNLPQDISHANLFNELMHSFGINHDNHLFVGYNEGRTFIDEFVLSKIKLDALGWKNISVDSFDKISMKNNDLIYDNKKIDVIRRGVELSKLRKSFDIMNYLLHANAIIINNFKMRLLGHKSLLIALSDSRFHKYLTYEETDAVENLLPQTIKLNKKNADKIIFKKDIWVLKPSDLAEGEGVVVGSSVTDTLWRKSIEEALQNTDHWVIQEKIIIPEETFNLVIDKKIVSSQKKYDLNPHIFLLRDRIEMGKMIVRFSESSILNVMQGGGLTYAFVKN